MAGAAPRADAKAAAPEARAGAAGGGGGGGAGGGGEGARRRARWLAAAGTAVRALPALAREERGWTAASGGDEGAAGGALTQWREVTASVRREVARSAAAPKGYLKKEKRYRMWRCAGELDAPAELVFRVLSDIAAAHRWNRVVTGARVIEALDARTDVTWYQSAPQAGGTVAARDFVSVRRCESLPGGVFAIASAGVIHPDAPPRAGVVRGWAGPGGFLVEPLPPRARPAPPAGKAAERAAAAAASSGGGEGGGEAGGEEGGAEAGARCTSDLGAERGRARAAPAAQRAGAPPSDRRRARGHGARAARHHRGARAPRHRATPPARPPAPRRARRRRRPLARPPPPRRPPLPPAGTPRLPLPRQRRARVGRAVASAADARIVRRETEGGRWRPSG